MLFIHATVVKRKAGVVLSSSRCSGFSLGGVVVCVGSDGCSVRKCLCVIFCRSGCGSLVASSVDLIVVFFAVCCAFVGCVTSSGVTRRSVCRGGVGGGGCSRPVGEAAMGLSGSGRELDVEVDGSRRGDVVRCSFVAGSATIPSVKFVCCPTSCVARLGKVSETGENYVATEQGVLKVRTVRRLQPDFKYDLALLNKVSGAPWAPRRNTCTRHSQHCWTRNYNRQKRAFVGLLSEVSCVVVEGKVVFRQIRKSLARSFSLAAFEACVVVGVDDVAIYRPCCMPYYPR